MSYHSSFHFKGSLVDFGTCVDQQSVIYKETCVDQRETDLNRLVLQSEVEGPAGKPS